MKKRIYGIVIFIILILSGCSVTPYSGSITVKNFSDGYAGNISVGSVYFGGLFPGQIRTLYFIREEMDAYINIEGFLLPESSINLKGVINLRNNFQYSMSLFNDKTYNISGYSIVAASDNSNDEELLR